MALKTLDPTVKQAFTSAGVSLSPQQEHLAATNTTIDWTGLLKALGNIAATLIPIIIGLFGGTTPPAPAPAQATGATCPCDHGCCCLRTFEAAIHTAKLAGEHLACCCCEHC